MHYILPNKLKIFAIVLMGIGFLGLLLGFLSVPTNLEEAQALVTTEHRGEGHGTEMDNAQGSTHTDSDEAMGYEAVSYTHLTLPTTPYV